ncbi:MAG TPA: L-threonine 3-dehydrogenase [Spirochaetes bacterium]|nr:L-threonine 3-dehydrogenase [Spirochaetota bacterium]
MMKAVYKADRSKGIEIRELPEPVISDNEVLIKVRSAAVCGSDIHLYNWNDWCDNVHAKNPIIIGHEFCGEVVDVGSNVSLVKTGDLVAGETHIPCGTCMLCRTGKQHICQDMKIVGVHTDGAFAQYTKIPEICAYKLPADTPHDIGAIYEPFTIAVHGVLKDKIGGCSTAIFGCGPIGLFAVNVASVCGASPVFAIDINDYRLKIAQKLSDNVIALNPHRDKIVEIVKDKTKGYGADVVIELAGSPEATRMGFELLRKSGRICIIGLHSREVSLDFVNNITYKEATVYGVTGREMFESWYQAENLMQSGKINVKDVLTHEFPLEETEKAILTAQEGKCGKAIIKIS